MIQASDSRKKQAKNTSTLNFVRNSVCIAIWFSGVYFDRNHPDETYWWMKFA